MAFAAEYVNKPKGENTPYSKCIFDNINIVPEDNNTAAKLLDTACGVFNHKYVNKPRGVHNTYSKCILDNFHKIVSDGSASLIDTACSDISLQEKIDSEKPN